MRSGAVGRARAIMCVVLVFTLIGVAVTTNPQISSLVEKAAQPMSLTNTDWHDGANRSTTAVDVTYKTEYSTRTAGGSNNTIEGVLSQIMQLSYNDGSGTSVAFGISCIFNPGGVDVENQTVLDWNQLNHIELVLSSSCTLNGTPISTMYNFQGFDIVSGNASEVNLSQQTSDGSTFYNLNNVVGCISYWGNAAKISAVTLSTENYTYQGQTLQESVATFNVTIAADMINLGLRASSSNEVQVPVPTVLTFQVTHNVTDTEYKYGANIDWSAAKAFPTMPALTTGQNYSLVAQDLLSFSYAEGPNDYNMTQIKAFSTDASNGSAIYFLSGKVMCRELLTTQYTMEGSSQVHNTTRIYVADAGHDQGGNVSSIYVVFDGFKYNQSTGLAFDPAVITPNSVASSSPSSSGSDQGLIVGLLLVAIVVIAVAVVVVMRRRHR